MHLDTNLEKNIKNETGGRGKKRKRNGRRSPGPKGRLTQAERVRALSVKGL